MNASQIRTALIGLVSFCVAGNTLASLVTCASADKKVSLTTTKKDEPTSEGDTDLAEINIKDHDEVFVNMHALTLGEELLMVNAVDYFAPRDRFKLVLGTLTSNHEYPKSHLTLQLPSKLRPDYSRSPAETLEFDLSCKVHPDHVLENVCKATGTAQYNTHLLNASATGDIDGVQQAIACGADINVANSVGCTALMSALSASGGECVGAETPTPPLNLLRWMQGAAILKYLLDTDASVFLQDAKGETIVHKAVNQGFPKEIPTLVTYGADLNQADTRGMTPLMDAASTGYVVGVVGLLDAGADVTKKNSQGKTAFDLAQHMPNKVLARLSGTESDGIVIQGTASGCTPLAIKVSMGDTAKITLKSDATNMFVLKSAGLGLDLMSSPGSSVSQTFKTDRMGTFSFQCGVHGGVMAPGNITISM
jgi:plastocyanin